MLSTAMVSVLAPHWSRRNQRTKKGLSTEDFEAQNVTHGPLTGAQNVHNRFLEPHRQYRGEGVRDGSLGQEWDPSVGPRRKTDGWSSMSGPSSINVNYTTKRLTPLSVSFDMDSCRLDNRDTVGLHNNPKENTPPPIPSLSLDQPRGQQGELSQPSSKPSTSSLLLSLRTIGSNWRRPTLSETGLRSLSVSNRDRAAVASTPGPSPTSPNNNSSERWTPRPYSSLIPTYRPAKSNPNISQTTSGTNPTHPQKQITQINQPSISDNNTDPTRLSQYEQYSILKSQALPRGTTLRSGTWWRQVTKEGSLQPSSKETANIINNNRNETNTPLVTPCNSNSDSASPSSVDNRHLIRQSFSHADNNKAEAMRGGTNDLVFKRQGSPDMLRRSNAVDRPDQRSDAFPTCSKGTNLNEKQPQCLNSSPSEVNEVNVNKASFKDNVTKSPVTPLPSSKMVSANIINQNVYSLDKCSLSANTQTALLIPSPISSPTIKDCKSSVMSSPKTQNENQYIYKSLSLDCNNILSCHTLKPASSQDISSPSTVLPRCTYNKPKPLIFERTYPSMTTFVHSKTSSLYQGTASSKPNYSPLSHTSPTIPTTPSSASVSTTTTPTFVTATTTTTSPTPLMGTSGLLTPPVTPTSSCSPSPKSSLSKRRTFSGNLDISPSNEWSSTLEGKSRRRVTWQDSVVPDEDKGQTPVAANQSPLQKTSPLSRARSPRSLECPSIFSFLREGSPTEVRQSSPVCSPILKTRSIEAQSGEISKQIVSAKPSSPMDWSSEHRTSATAPGPDQRLSDRASQWRSSTPLSLPADIGYQQRYSSPPYSTLKSTRSPQGDAKNPLPTSPGIHQQTFSPPFVTRPKSLCLDPVANRISVQPHHSPTNLVSTQIVPLPFPNRSVLPGGLKFDLFKSKEADNNGGKQSHYSNKNTSESQVDNKAVIGSKPFSLLLTRQDKTFSSSSTCLNVIETLVYSLSKGNSTASPDNTTPKSLMQCTSNTTVSVETKPSFQLSTKHIGVGGNQYVPLNQNSNTGNTKEAQMPLFTATGDSSNNHKSPSCKTERTSTPSVPANQEAHCVPDRATVESAQKGINKIDHVFSKLKQTFGGSQSSKTASIGSSSDSNISDVTFKSNDTLEGDKEGKRTKKLGDAHGEMGKEKDKGKQNRYILIPSRMLGNTRGDNFSSHSDIMPEVNVQNQFSLSSQPFTQPEAQTERTSPRQVCRQQHVNESDEVDARTSTSPRGDPNPRRQSPGDPRCPANRPRSPFSLVPFTAPLSPLATGLEIDDSVFYSHKEMTPPGEMGRSISPLGKSRRQMSTGPRTRSPSQERGCLVSYSSCADLKYGIEAGRSISVSSVVSSRRLGSKPISTGSRVLSVDNLCDPTHETLKYKCQSMGDPGNASSYRLSNCPSEMRSRSLPRSLSRSLSCWSTEGSPPKDHLSSPTSRDTARLQLYSAGGPTPPPSPPSPAARLMSKSPSRSSPGSPAASKDCQSPLGLLPRGSVASLSDFEDSSDSSSDSSSTTDDEYYLDSEEDDDKETAL